MSDLVSFTMLAMVSLSMLVDESDYDGQSRVPTPADTCSSESLEPLAETRTALRRAYG